MSTTALTGLEENEPLRPYIMQEIDDMLDEAEAAFEAGDYLTNDAASFGELWLRKE